MPTLLGLCRVPIPSTVEGLDYNDYIRKWAYTVDVNGTMPYAK